MPSKSQTEATPAVLRIEGELTIFRATEMKELLLASPLPTEIDLSGVTEFDSAGLHLVGHSDAVTEVFELLNVAAFFGDPLVVAASQASTGAQHSSSTSTTRRHDES
jgi:anti-sigma B factor antagonist